MIKTLVCLRQRKLPFDLWCGHTGYPPNLSASPDINDIIITKYVISPLCEIFCSALISDHVPLLNDKTHRSSFFHPPDHQDFRSTDWATFQASLEDGILLKPDLHDEVANDTCVDELFSALGSFPPKRRLCDNLRHVLNRKYT